eukprot:scaffold420_cov404-Prasinococcus_capsulatus_cf.AAC.11
MHTLGLEGHSAACGTGQLARPEGAQDCRKGALYRSQGLAVSRVRARLGAAALSLSHTCTSPPSWAQLRLPGARGNDAAAYVRGASSCCGLHKSVAGRWAEAARLPAAGVQSAPTDPA